MHLDTATPFRFFEGSRWVVDRPDGFEDIEVYIAGVQPSDSSVAREIMVRLHQPITVSDARQLGAALIAAADEAATMAGYDQITVSPGGRADLASSNRIDL